MRASVGQVRDMWCPVLYRVALHHVATFIAEQPDTSIAQQLRSRIQQLGNKVRTHFIYNMHVHGQVGGFCYFNKCKEIES